jgi:hypothetical protein
MSILRWLTFFGLTAYFAALLLLFLFQRSFLYHPDRSAITPAQAGLRDFAAVQIGAKSDSPTSWWRPPAQPGGPVIIIFHGNGGALAGRSNLYATIAGVDYGVLAVGYPGYGGNSGSPSEQSLFQAANANYQWLVSNNYKPDQIIIVGQSLGTGVAIWLAANNRAAGLILQSPYTSMADMAAKQMPFFPARYLIKDKYDSMARIGAVQMPVAWIHGAEDALIPAAMGQNLLNAANQPNCSFIMPAAGHNDMPDNEVGAHIRKNVRAMVSDGRCA